MHSRSTTVVLEIFTGCNFHVFHDKGWVHENQKNKMMDRYKMAAVVSESDFNLFVIKIDNNVNPYSKLAKMS